MVPTNQVRRKILQFAFGRYEETHGKHTWTTKSPHLHRNISSITKKGKKPQINVKLNTSND